MAELFFPDTISAPNYPYDESPIDRLITQETDSGHIYSRPRYSKPLNQITVKWNAMKESEFQILKDFYENITAGGAISFQWPDIPSHTYRKVKFLSPYTSSMNIYGRRSVSFVLQEVF